MKWFSTKLFIIYAIILVALTYCIYTFTNLYTHKGLGFYINIFLISLGCFVGTMNHIYRKKKKKK
ncbi:hypothetical protein GCM10007342_16490 [Staphylococcus pragensis]|nr:hypothetical protein GCM10007342_16490 [Staphylococcus pragensis]